MQEGYWVVRTYEAGAVGEKTKFFVQGSRPTGKIRRKDRDTARKQEQNEYSAQKALARLINANFTAGDLLMGLDYSEEGMDKILTWARENGLPVDSEDEAQQMDAIWEDASHELDNALRRVKRRLKKQGMDLKAVYSTSDMDGETGEAVRVHHHLVVSAGTQDAFLDAWEKCGLGSVSWTPLWKDQEDRTPIAEYIIRQVRRIPDAKKYRSTRNLARAKEMRSAGVADETIRQQTGWHTGMDGKWRWEIDDSGMEYSGRGDLGLRERRPEYARYRELLDKANRHALELSDEALTPEEAAELQKLKNIWGGTFRKAGRITEGALPTELLSDYVKHDALFEAYPQLRKTRLRFADLPEGTRGQYDPEQDIITLSNKLRGKPQRPPAACLRCRSAYPQTSGRRSCGAGCPDSWTPGTYGSSAWASSTLQ